MQHPDGDDLALFALGESLGSAVADHVAGCAECASEVESFRTTVGLAELSNFGEIAPQPGEHVWQAIATELGFEEASGDVLTEIDDRQPAPRGIPPTLRSVPGTGTKLPPTVAAGLTGPTDSPAPTDSTGQADSTRPTGPKRWSRWVAPLAAVVVGIAVGAGAVIIAQNRGSDITVEAVAPLTPVKGGPLQGRHVGTAELVAAPTGQQVRVDATDLPPTANDYEVWLFGGDGKMVSLGTLNDGSGTFTVPQGINTLEYRTVDVSDEKPDGNPLHSGISLIRGSFS